MIALALAIPAGLAIVVTLFAAARFYALAFHALPDPLDEGAQQVGEGDGGGFHMQDYV